MSDEIVGYLGPQGTFSEQASQAIFPGRSLKPYPDILSVLEAINDNTLSTGVLPIENFLEGTVTPVLDGLTSYPDVKICGEFILPVSHHLLVTPGLNPDKITAILSHPHALAQCKKYLRENFSHIPYHHVTSTAEAARQVSLELHNCAAIGNKIAAHLYGLKILAKDIGDIKENYTRFIVLSKDTTLPTGNDKTSIVFTVEHTPGSLSQMLTLFAKAEINLTKIESRPSRKIMGEYLFYVDFEGHLFDAHIKEIITTAKQYATHLSIMGSYPKSNL